MRELTPEEIKNIKATIYAILKYKSFLNNPYLSRQNKFLNKEQDHIKVDDVVDLLKDDEHLRAIFVKYKDSKKMNWELAKTKSDNIFFSSLYKIYKETPAIEKISLPLIKQFDSHHFKQKIDYTEEEELNAITDLIEAGIIDKNTLELKDEFLY